MNISPVNAVGMKYNTPNFGAAPKMAMINPLKMAMAAEQPVKTSGIKNFINSVKTTMNNGWDRFIENGIVKPIVAPVMNSKMMGKIADGSAKIDNMAAHMSTAGSFVTTAVYANRTLNNDKLDKKRARTLALNQVMVTALSTVGGYLINGKLDKFSKNLGYKFREANQGSAKLTKRMQGFNIAKQLLIFSMMYRYVAPVLVTPLASKVGKCIDNKKAVKAQALGQTAPVANAQPAPVAQQAAPVKAPVAAQTVAPVQPQVAPKTQTLATALESLHKHQATQTQFKA